MNSFSLFQKKYIQQILEKADHLEKQSDVFNQIAQAMYDSFKSGGVLHVFGSGHSAALSQELFHRAGGLVPVNAIFESSVMPHNGPRKSGPLERLSGFAEIILNNQDIRAGEIIVIASNSGINAVPVELAQKARSQGLKIVSITSLEHSKKVPKRSAYKLFEVSDWVIDTGVPYGDACIDVPGMPIKAVPLSSIVTLLAAELLVCRVCEIYTEKGEKPPVYQSANTPGGDDHNKVLENLYLDRLSL